VEQIYVGIDIHRKFSLLHVQNQKGEKLDTKRLNHDDVESIREYFMKYPHASVVMEASCGWMWFTDLLQELGFNVHLAHSSGVKAISSSHKKTDKEDAQILANLLRSNFLPEAYLSPKEVRDDRELFRHRAAMVKLRTNIKNKVHAQLIKLNFQPNSSDIFNIKGRAIIEKYQLSDVHQTVLDGWLSIIDFLELQIKSMEDIIKDRLKKDPRSVILQSMPGIGYLTAYAMISEIGDINRFRSAHAFCCYCGLVPSTKQSADKTRHGKLISGHSCLKLSFVESTHVAIRKDKYFKDIYERQVKTKSKCRSVIVCAHKMGLIVYKMLKENRTFIKNKTQNDEKKVGSNVSMTD